MGRYRIGKPEDRRCAVNGGGLRNRRGAQLSTAARLPVLKVSRRGYPERRPAQDVKPNASSVAAAAAKFVPFFLFIQSFQLFLAQYRTLSGAPVSSVAQHPRCSDNFILDFLRATCVILYTASWASSLASKNSFTTFEVKIDTVSP